MNNAPTKEQACAAVGMEAQHADPQAELYGPAMARLKVRQRIFVREYLTDYNGKAAAVRAGYSEARAKVTASELLKRGDVQAAITEEQASRLKRLELDADEVLIRWARIFFGDPNLIIQYRRVCCRHCHGAGFDYQFTPGEYRATKATHDVKRAEIQAAGGQDIGEFEAAGGDWYDKRRAPHQDCPECFGEGVGEVFITDTRHLPPDGQALFAGAERRRDGTIQVHLHDKQRAGEMLGRALGLFSPGRLDVAFDPPDMAALDAIYAQAMQRAQERQVQVLETRQTVLKEARDATR